MTKRFGQSSASSISKSSGWKADGGAVGSLPGNADNRAVSILSAAARAGSWQPLPEGEWQPTIRSLHRWSQVVGKVRLGLAPPLNHWWHVPLYVSASGLTTSPIPYGGGLFELEFDFLEGALILRSSDGSSEMLPLGPMSVATFYAEARNLLRRAGIDVRIRPVPTEVVDAIPFPEDVTPGGYEPDHARALHGALINAHRLLTQFRGEFIGKSSPVHFFWGGFDIAASRFSGRPAPRHPGGVPNCPDYVQVEAYSHEVSSAGWWPGTDMIPPAFYAYMYPEPAGFSTAKVEPTGALYEPDYREFILPYRDVVESGDPDAAVLAFLESTYAAGATLAGWDREALERR
jgi:Family of unknown function (DUF5996)